MKQEDKDLLLRYLSMALPYGVIINTPNGDGYLNSINQTIFGNEYGININPTRRDYFNDEKNILKPYLRPLSAMTEEEKDEYSNTFDVTSSDVDDYDIFNVKAVDWLIEHKFDVRDLIPKGLAIAVTKENNPYCNKENNKKQFYIPFDNSYCINCRTNEIACIVSSSARVTPQEEKGAVFEIVSEPYEEIINLLGISYKHTFIKVKSSKTGNIYRTLYKRDYIKKF